MSSHLWNSTTSGRGHWSRSNRPRRLRQDSGQNPNTLGVLGFVPDSTASELAGSRRSAWARESPLFFHWLTVNRTPTVHIPNQKPGRRIVENTAPIVLGIFQRPRRMLSILSREETP
jgi:hypothetical protein